jgi:hypothetical protein
MLSMKPFRFRLSFAMLLLSGCGLARASDEGGLIIAVRSSVDRAFVGLHKAPIVEHGKAYIIAALNEAPTTRALVQPVDQGNLLLQLRRALAKRGFHEVTTMAETPDIALTVVYGRGWLKNPYLDEHTMPVGMSEPPVVSMKGTDIQQMIREREPGYEAKLQDASHEKLFIHLTAWEFPGKQPAPKAGKKKKPLELWKTTMVIDDPANRDLNQFIEKMLAAGAKYFDREIKDEEAFVDTDLPEGTVKYGEAKVMPAHKDDSK